MLQSKFRLVRFSRASSALLRPHFRQNDIVQLKQLKYKQWNEINGTGVSRTTTFQERRFFCILHENV